MAKKFDLLVREWADEAEIAIEDAIIKISLDAFTGVLLRTRVDTGRLRGSWRIALNAQDNTAAEAGDFGAPTKRKAGDKAEKKVVEPTGEDEAAALDTLGQVQLGDIVYITNSLPYAIYVNEKDDIVGDTVREVLSNLEEAIAEVTSQ